MLLVHATDVRHLASIRSGGLQVQYHRLRRPAIWLASASGAAWATIHAMTRHGIPAERVCLIYVEVPRAWLRRFRHRGLYYCPQNIPPERIRRVVTFTPKEEVA